MERGELDRWNRTIATNLTSVFLISHAVVSRLPDRSDTAIVNIASMAGLRGFPEEAAYDALDEKKLDVRIRKVEKEMLEAARNLEFERAAQLRDELKRLRDRLMAVGGEG